MARKGKGEETPGAKADRERRERLAQDNRDYYLLQQSRGKRRITRGEYQAQQRERDRDLAGRYDRFIRLYGTPEQKEERRQQAPTREQVANWWDSRGKAARWVGPDTNEGKEQHPRKPAERPRRTGTSAGDLIGGWFSSDDPEPDDTPPSGGGGGGGGLGIFQPPGGGSNNPPPDDNGGGGLGIFKST